MDGLRFERRGEGEYYKVVLHIRNIYVPISDEDVEALHAHSASPGDQFLEFFLDRVGYSSYLKDQLRAELLNIGERPQQLAALRQSLRDMPPA